MADKQQLASPTEKGAPDASSDSEHSAGHSGDKRDRPADEERPVDLAPAQPSPSTDFPDGGLQVRRDAYVSANLTVQAWSVVAGSWLIIFSTFGLVRPRSS